MERPPVHPWRLPMLFLILTGDDGIARHHLCFCQGLVSTESWQLLWMACELLNMSFKAGLGTLQIRSQQPLSPNRKPHKQTMAKRRASSKHTSRESPRTYLVGRQAHVFCMLGSASKKPIQKKE
jgi:hypothetical protein